MKKKGLFILGYFYISWDFFYPMRSFKASNLVSEKRFIVFFR